MKKRDGRNIGADSAQGLKIPDFEMSVLFGYYPRRRSNGVSSYCGCVLEVLSALRHKAWHFLLRLLPQIRIQSLADDVRIVQVVLKAKFGKSLS